MPKFAANLTMMYPELPFLDRFEAAAKDGFKAVEYLFPYAFEAKELAARLKNNGLQQVLFNLPPGGVDAKSIDEAWNNGTRGIACIAGREAEFAAGADLALRYAEVLDCPRLHMMAGLLPKNALSTAENKANTAPNLRQQCQNCQPIGSKTRHQPAPRTHQHPRYSGFFPEPPRRSACFDC